MTVEGPSLGFPNRSRDRRVPPKTTSKTARRRATARMPFVMLPEAEGKRKKAGSPANLPSRLSGLGSSGGHPVSVRDLERYPRKGRSFGKRNGVFVIFRETDGLTVFERSAALENVGGRRRDERPKLARIGSFGVQDLDLAVPERFRPVGVGAQPSVVRVDTYFPSSKTCSQCGYKRDELDLSVRSWTCPKCGAHLDRDVNAEVNLKAEGIRMLRANGPVVLRA